MKLRKILALALTLCVAASLMAPMASAATYETRDGKVASIDLTAEVYHKTGSNYDVTLKAELAPVSSDYEAFFPVDEAKFAELLFTCTLSGDAVKKLDNPDFTLTDETDLFVQDGTTALDKDNGTIKIVYKLKNNTNKSTIESKLNGTNKVTFTSNTVAITASDAALINNLTAFVEVSLSGVAYADRIAYGQAKINNTYPPSDDDDSGSGGSGSGTTTTPADEVIDYKAEDESVTDETAPKTPEQAANEAIVKNALRNNVTKRNANPNDKTYSIDMDGLATDTAKDHISLKGVKIIDKTTGEEIPVDANGNFVMPAGGVDIVAEYESVPYTPEESGVNGLLNTKDHIAYTQGDAMGNWNPNKNITRAEAATMIYRLLLNQNVEKTVSFTDVPEGKWFTEPVLVLASLGILKGSNGQYRPFDTINRAEFTAMCVRFATKDAGKVGKEFADVSSTFWAHDEIGKAAALNWVIGFPDGYFKPADGMTRAQAVTMINRILGRPGDDSAIQAGQGVSFNDVKPTFWGYTAITESATPHNYTMDDVSYTETWVKG